MSKIFSDPRHVILLHVGIHSLANACLEGNVPAVRKLLEQGWSVHDSTDEGESLLSLACSAGKYSASLNRRILPEKPFIA